MPEWSQHYIDYNLLKCFIKLSKMPGMNNPLRLPPPSGSPPPPAPLPLPLPSPSRSPPPLLLKMAQKPISAWIPASLLWTTSCDDFLIVWSSSTQR